MADNKKSQVPADDQKASSIVPEASLTPVTETKKKIRKAPKVKKPKKKGVPIVVDILIVLLILGVIAGAGFGIYSLGKYFATRYAQKEITYTMLLRDADAALVLDKEGDCVIKPDSEVYLADGTGSYVLGSVLSTSVEFDEDGTVDVYVSVRTEADYNYTLGYFVDQTKIAVGKTYNCRFSGIMDEAVIVDLQILEQEA